MSMKLNDILTEQQLDEITIRQLMAAGTMAAAGAAIPTHMGHSVPAPEERTQMPIKNDIKDMADIITKKYRIDPKKAEHIVRLAKKYEKPDFPRAKDILAIIGIESSFNPESKSRLRRDPALGLTQVRAKMWKVDPKMLIKDIEAQIRIGADILSKYYRLLNHKVEDAVHAYNVGLTNFRKKILNPQYVAKFKTERSMYA